MLELFKQFLNQALEYGYPHQHLFPISIPKWMYLNPVIITLFLYNSKSISKKVMEYLTVISIHEKYTYDENNLKLFL